MEKKYFKANINGYWQFFEKICAISEIDMVMPDGREVKAGDCISISYPVNEDGKEIDGDEVTEKEFIGYQMIIEEAILTGNYEKLIAKK